MSYRLARESARRRRLILDLQRRSEAEASIADDESPSADAQADALAPVDVAPSEQEAVTPRFDPSPTAAAFSFRGVERAVWTSEQRLTWVFAGDSLLMPTHEGRTWRSVVGHVSQAVRRVGRRSRDVFVNATSPGMTVAGLSAEVQIQVLKMSPDIVFWMLGQEDATAGMSGLPEFERELERLLRLFSSRGILVLLNTPPCVPETDSSRMVDRLVYLEAVRALSAEYEMPLVDHWEHWEAAAVEAGGIESWCDEDGQNPGSEGHRQMADLALRTLKFASTTAAID